MPAGAYGIFVYMQQGTGARELLDRQSISHSRPRKQWRRGDLLRGGAKMEIMSWGTHGRVQQLLDD